MGLQAERIAEGLAALAAIDLRIAAAAEKYGPPVPRIRPRGYETLLRAIVSQQISTAAAASVWRKLETLVGDLSDPARLLAADPATLRAGGLSRQKVDYAHSLAAHIVDGSLALEDLPAEDEAAIARLVAVKGLGRWSAEIYLLFAEGRADVFPAGDLAIQIQAGRLLCDAARPTERALRDMAAPWRPHRGIAALFLWHCYNAPPL